MGTADMVAHTSREDARKNWDAIWVDPGFQELVKSEKTEKLVEKVNGTCTRPANFSPM